MDAGVTAVDAVAVVDMSVVMEPDAAWLEGQALGPCEAPANLPPDPMNRSGVVDIRNHALGTRLVHILDADEDPTNGWIYMGGVGGLFAFEHDGGNIELIGSSSAGERGAKFDKLEAMGDGLVLTSERNLGLTVYDASSPPTISRLGSINESDLSGMAWAEPFAYLGRHTGELLTLNLEEPASPEVVHRLEGLGNPWEIVVAGNRGYVADNSLGVVVIDLSVPSAPVLGAAVTAAGSAQDLWIDGTHLYVAVGGAGVEIFSLADPDIPVSVALVDYGASIVSVSVAENILWATNHEQIIAVDVTDPTNPQPLAAQRTDQWAMHVVASGSTAYVADWGQLAAYDIDPTLRAPEADLSRTEIYMGGDQVETRFSMVNQGSDRLVISGLSIDDPRFEISLSSSEAPSAGRLEFLLRFMDDGEPINAEICIATNDPDQPLQRIDLRSTSGVAAVALGDPAPDFVLRDLDGESHQLSQQLGHPVVLCYFATW